MKKIIKKISLLLAFLFLFVACSKDDEKQDNVQSNKVDREHAYLVDTKTQKEIKSLLEKHGVTTEQSDILISWANDYNSRITSKPLKEGFISGQEVDYNTIFIENKEAEDGYIYPEANCRLTSYLLMKNMIETNKKQISDDTFLVFDIEAIDSYEPFYMNKDERDNFITLFNWVPMEDAKTLEEHKEKIKNAWKDRDIKINGNDISLITVYLHSTFDDVRFVGHTGVLIEEKNELIFIEKYGPIYPFKTTKFKDRDDLKEYLLSRPDLYGDETELEPIVMENDKVI